MPGWSRHGWVLGPGAAAWLRLRLHLLLHLLHLLPTRLLC